MKYISKYIVPAVLTTLLVGCKAELEPEQPDVQQDAINLSLNFGSASVTQTRGTGTVGGTTAETNKWRSENLYVLMTNVPGKNQPVWGYTDSELLGEPFNGTDYCRPVLRSDGKWYLDYESYNGNQKKYYPTDGTRSDFFVFYIDDAANEYVGGHPVIKNKIQNDTTKVINFTIDGSQDLLAGKAMKTSADSLIDTTRGYSAKTSRLGIIPNINMEHLLTRFTFGVVPGHTNADGMIIKNINLVSKYKGELTVAYNEDVLRTPESIVAWNDATTELSLKSKNDEPSTDGKPHLKPFEPYTLLVDGEKVKEAMLGDALFVNPNETYYQLFITYLFPMGEGRDPLELRAELPVKLANDAIFARGSSYHITITVNGLSDIVLTTSLEQWKEGGGITLETDEYFFPAKK